MKFRTADDKLSLKLHRLFTQLNTFRWTVRDKFFHVPPLAVRTGTKPESGFEEAREIEESFQKNHSPYKLQASKGLYYAFILSLLFWLVIIYFVLWMIH